MNKPVAWMIKDNLPMLGDFEFPCLLFKNKPHNDGFIPLYTHPVKELTDGEIQEISHQYHYTYNPDYVGFAKAILRKAQEK